MTSDFDLVIRHVLVSYLIPILRWITFYLTYRIAKTKLSKVCLFLISFDVIFLMSVAVFGFRFFNIKSSEFVESVHTVILTICLPSLVVLLKRWAKQP